MEAIVLAGGFGTRLQSVINNVPKPMADIGGKPFLHYLLTYLSLNGFTRVILSVGYLKEQIIEYFGMSFNGMKIIYSSEQEPLGTGGAVKKALGLLEANECFVLNGDTFFRLDFINMLNFHKNKLSKLTIAVKEMDNIDRYGSVNIVNDEVISFEEKQYKKHGIINAGVYLLSKNAMNDINTCCDRFSFEKDFLEKYIDKLKPKAYIANCYFIDIGIPEDYYTACDLLNDYI